MEVSVIIPVYNKFDYLETCLRSVLDQEMDDFEVVVVDDGSTDGSGEVCDRLAAEYARLRVIHVANGGVTRARRIAFNASSGRYVTFVDADDRMLPGGLKTLYESIERVGSDEVIATYVDNSGRLCDSGMRGFVDPDVLIRQLCGSKAHFCILWAVIFRREILEGCLDEARVVIRPGQDILMQLMCLAGRPKVFFIEDSVYCYNAGITAYKTPCVEAQEAFDEMLRRAFTWRWSELKGSYTLRQVKAYETLLTFNLFDDARRYLSTFKADIDGGVPPADRIVCHLPPRLALLLIRCWRRIIPLLPGSGC